MGVGGRQVCVRKGCGVDGGWLVMMSVEGGTECWAVARGGVQVGCVAGRRSLHGWANVTQWLGGGGVGGWVWVWGGGGICCMPKACMHEASRHVPAGKLVQCFVLAAPPQEGSSMCISTHAVACGACMASHLQPVGQQAVCLSLPPTPAYMMIICFWELLEGAAAAAGLAEDA